MTLALLPLFLSSSTVIAASSQPIVGGVDHAGDPAIVLIELSNGGYCTGTLISPRVVLTAAHCLDGPPEEVVVRFVVDASKNGPSIVGAVSAIAGDSDLGVLALAQTTSGITPLFWNWQADRVQGNAAVRLVGYGSTAEELVDYGRKRLGFAKIAPFDGRSSDLRPDEFGTITGGQSTCYGDSGGPVLVEIDDVEQVVGVNSRGTDVCGTGLDIAVRTDAHDAFLRDFLKAQDPDFCANNACDLPLVARDGGCASAAGTTWPGLFAVFLAFWIYCARTWTPTKSTRTIRPRRPTRPPRSPLTRT